MASQQSWVSDLAQFYNDGEFSDVTVKFGDREIKAHRMILSAGCPVFKKALAPNSIFPESKTGTYELDDDTPEAAECMLRYIYTSAYSLGETADYGHLARWERHLHVAIIADKYDLPTLEALEACIADITKRKSEKFNVTHLIAQASYYDDRGERLAQVILDLVDVQFASLFHRADVQEWLGQYPEGRERLVVEHFDELVGMEAFRDALRTDGEMALRHLDRVHSEATQSRVRVQNEWGQWDMGVEVECAPEEKL